MRSRTEILDDGLRATEKPVDYHQTTRKIPLLTLEVLVDIRDVLNELNDGGIVKLRSLAVKD